MTAYSIAPRARLDMAEIWEYVAADSPAAADRMIDLIHQRFRLLAANPLAGELREELRPGLRFFTAGKYVIYYQLADAGIVVVRVVHGARDIGAIF